MCSQWIGKQIVMCLLLSQRMINHVFYNEDEKMNRYAYFLNFCYRECGNVILSFVHLRRDHDLWWTTSVDDMSSRIRWFKDGFEVMGLPSSIMIGFTKAKLVTYATWSMKVISTCIHRYVGQWNWFHSTTIEL
jgi:hypothetical protein